MKFFPFPFIFCVFVLLGGTSCKKQNTVQDNPAASRKVRFLLYTLKDFSGNDELIRFDLSIQKLPNQILWDSFLPPMRIKDIPAKANALVIEKEVPGNSPSLLKVGFYYSIENVGYSWYLDSFKIGETLKIVDFNFQ